MREFWRVCAGILGVLVLGMWSGPGKAASAVETADAAGVQRVAFPFRDGDRVAWVGSSSTHFGIWPKTVEFLLRTRQPRLHLTFKLFSTGGGTFATGIEHLPAWMKDFSPTLIVFNYGANDAGAGAAGLDTFRQQMTQCVEMAQKAGARVVLTTFQAADSRRSGEQAAANRKLYAEAMLAYAHERRWPIVDVFHPLDRMQMNAERDDPAYSMMRDQIHLLDSAYVAWGYFFYERISPPDEESFAELSARGRVLSSRQCRVQDVTATAGGLTFTREDNVLPILPPILPPPRKYVPLESLSRYLLKIRDLKPGRYDIRCEGKPVGTADAAALSAGVNLNSLLLDSRNAAPWNAVSEQVWNGSTLQEVGPVRLHFEVVPSGN